MLLSNWSRLEREEERESGDGRWREGRLADEENEAEKQFARGVNEGAATEAGVIAVVVAVVAIVAIVLADDGEGEVEREGMPLGRENEFKGG